MAEISGALRETGHQHRAADRLPPAGYFITEHPERLPLAVVELRYIHRAAGTESELIALERGYSHAEEVPGVKIVIAKELKQRGVKFIRATLGSDIDHRSGVAAKFSRVVRGLNTELGDRVQ